MHIINIPIILNPSSEKAYIAAVAKVMNIDLPNKIKLTTPNEDKLYSILSYNVAGIKKEKPEE